MAKNQFEIKGLEEYQEKLKTVRKKAPDRILKELDNKGNQLRRKARANTPKVSGKLRGGYQLTKAERRGLGYQKGMYNSAPHHHLVNNGHRKVTPGGRVVGWTEGLFYIERTVAEQEPIIMSQLQSWLNVLYAELK